LKKKVSVLFVLRILKLVIGIFNLSLSAKYFGISIERDAWILALNGIVVLDTAIWGPINETFRAKFIFIREHEGIHVAMQKTRSLVFFTFLITICIAALVLLLPKPFSQLLGPGLSGKAMHSLQFMVMLLAPSFLFNQLSLILTSVLNANQSFYTPEVSSFISSVLNLGILILLAPIIGINALVVSYYIGLFLLLVLLFYQLRKRDINLFKVQQAIRFSDCKVFFLYALPFFLPYFFGQLNALIEKSLASGLGEGMVSIVDYGRKFPDIALSVMSSVLTTIMVPTLSHAFARKEEQHFYASFKQIYQLGFLIIGLLICLLTVSGPAIIDFFYDRGTIAPSALRQISHLAMLYSWAGLGIFLYLMYGLALLAADQRKRYAAVGIIAQLLMIATNYLLAKKWGSEIFPLSMLGAHLFTAFLMWPYFPYAAKSLITLTIKYLFIVLATCLPCFLISRFLVAPMTNWLTIAIDASLIAGFMLGNLFLFKAEERLMLSNLLRKIKIKDL